MSRTERAKPILDAAERWKTRCLLGGGSVLSGEKLWNADGFDQLNRYFVENLDYGSGGFLSKLRGQLEPASAEAKKLAAEILWVMYLIVFRGSISAETKRFQIRQVWKWSGSELPQDDLNLGDLLDQGVSNPGAAYNTHRWREFRFFITAMVDWTGLESSRRSELLEDPWRFAKWLEDREYAPGRQLRHVLLFLLFPDQFDKILTASQKKELVEKFFEKWEEKPDVDYANRVSLDRAVLQVRERLESENPGESVDFYSTPYRSVWRPEKSGSDEVTPDLKDPYESWTQEGEAWFKKRFGDAGVWVLSAGEGGRHWSNFVEDGVAAIGWDSVGDATEYSTREALHEAVAEATGREHPTNDSLAIWQFSREMKPGDVIVIKKGRTELLGWGRVKGPYLFDETRPEYKHVHQVDWQGREPVTMSDGHRVAIKTLTDAGGWKPWASVLIRLLEGEKVESRQPAKMYEVAEAIEDLFVSLEDFSSILDAISRRKNLILQGPPGVGKTFIAKRIAWSLIGKKDPEYVEMVQFHQSYAYEDFIQGWRPTETGGFTLRNGVFYDFCDRAREKLKTPFVFIIDEINRGNLSRIFGELLMLIEADKRGPDHALPLTYSEPGSKFCVPPNVHILGLMNTADRSLAMVDYALRRRFAFVNLEPAFGSELFMNYLVDANVDEDLVRLIDERFSALNAKVRSDTKNLGPGFEIGHSYFVPTGDEESLDIAWYREVVRTQVEPLLREYWFDQRQHVDELVEGLMA